MTDRQRIVDTAFSDVKVGERTTWRHVVLATDGGLLGIGEATIGDAAPDFSTELRRAAALIVGRPVDAETLRPLAPMRRRSLPERTIRSALDQAVRDLRAQIEGLPLFRHLAPDATRRVCSLYANVNRRTRDRSASGFAASARAAAEAGFAAIKCAPFDGLAPALCAKDRGAELIAAGLERLRAAAAAAPGCEMMVDCHWRLSEKAAHALLPALSEIGVVWFECPLPEAPSAVPELRALRAAANRLGVRLSGLETFGGWDEVRPFVEGGAYDVIMPDVKHVGGLDALLDLARRAQTAGVAASLHNPSGPIAHLVSAHAAAALGSEERLELQWSESPLFFEITEPAPVVEAGACRPTETPGLGARLKDGAAP